jgi:hypothetical protein
MNKKYYWIILLVIGFVIFLFSPLISIFLVAVSFILGLIETEKDRTKRITSIIVFLIIIIALLFIVIFGTHF